MASFLGTFEGTNPLMQAKLTKMFSANKSVSILEQGSKKKDVFVFVFQENCHIFSVFTMIYKTVRFRMVVALYKHTSLD